MAAINKQVSIKEAQRIFSDAKNFEKSSLAGYFRLIRVIYGGTEQIKYNSLSIANIEKVLSKLTERNHKILRLRFWDCYSLRKTGKVFSVTVEAIRLKETRILRNIKMQKNEFEVNRNESEKQNLMVMIEQRNVQNCNISIDVLELSTRSHNALKRSKIFTIGQLTSKNERELLEIKNLGTSSVEEIKNKLKEYLPQLELAPNKQTLSKLGLPGYAKNRLNSNGIYTIDQFIKLKKEDLIQIPGLGRKSIQIILDKQQQRLSK